jgi:hypothetical protein
MLSGPDTIATIGFQSQVKGLNITLKNVSFLFFLYFHFATKLAALSAFSFHLEFTGLITT